MITDDRVDHKRVRSGSKTTARILCPLSADCVEKVLFRWWL